MDKYIIMLIIVVVLILSYCILDSRLDALEAASTCAQQPNERNLLLSNDSSGWVFESCDTSIITRNDYSRKIVTFYYKK